MSYHFEQVRLATFRRWPVAFMKPRDLAAAGFYYLGEADRIKCFSCNTVIYNWEPGDNAVREHEKWHPRCRYRTFNIPMFVNPLQIPESWDVPD